MDSSLSLTARSDPWRVFIAAPTAAATASPVALSLAGDCCSPPRETALSAHMISEIDVVTFSPDPEAPLLEMKNVTKTYRGVAALKNVDFDLRRGEVHALVGENGAGKSTLVKILSGAVTPTNGEIRLEGQQIQI